MVRYEIIKNGNTEFFIDWEVVYNLTKSYWIAKLQTIYCEEVPVMPDSHWYNPMDYWLPTMTQLEVDWNRVQAGAVARAKNEIQGFRSIAKDNVPAVAYKLCSRIDEAIICKHNIMEKMRKINSMNHQNIEKSVTSYGSGLKFAEFTRDFSAEGLLIGASIASGGAAVGLLATGSILKGTATFQNTLKKTGSVDSAVAGAVMEGVGSFIFGSFKIEKTLSFKQDMILTLFKAPYKVGSELLSGESFHKAVISGAVKLMGPAVDKIFKTDLVKKIFTKAPFTITIPDNASAGLKNISADLIRKYSGKMTQYTLEKDVKSLASLEGNSIRPSSAESHSFLNNITLTNKALLYLAIVNRSKGIGRGW